MKRQRRRTIVMSVSAAALLAGGPLLTGCSTGSHPGAAAVVGGERITVAEVQSHVEAVREAQRAQPNADELIAVTSGLTRQTVNFLVYLEVIDHAAADHGIEVTRRQVQEERDRAEEFAGGRERLEMTALIPQQPGVVPLTSDQIDEVLRSNVQYRQLAEQVGEQRVGEVLAETAEEIGVDVNPRYGQWDPQAVALTDAEMPWLRAPEEDAGAGARA